MVKTLKSIENKYLSPSAPYKRDYLEKLNWSQICHLRKIHEIKPRKKTDIIIKLLKLEKNSKRSREIHKKIIKDKRKKKSKKKLVVFNDQDKENVSVDEFKENAKMNENMQHILLSPKALVEKKRIPDKTFVFQKRDDNKNKNSMVNRNLENDFLQGIPENTKVEFVSNCIIVDSSKRQNSFYSGEIHNGVPNGRGEFFNTDIGDKYIGGFKMGEKHGFGEYHFKNGDKFVGEYRNNKQYKGMFYFQNGDSYKINLEN